MSTFLSPEEHAERLAFIDANPMFYCNKCGYFGVTRRHPGCAYMAGDSYHRERALLASHAIADVRIAEQARRIAELEEALRTLPLWTPEPRENRVKDPLYGWTAPEFYPASVLVDSEKLVAARRVLENARAAIGEKP